MWAVKADPDASNTTTGMPKPDNTGNNNDMKVANAYKRTLVAASLVLTLSF